ncbi:MAG: transaldolase [Deltaproteobacteria bacterium]|jgi:transaldolase|nr:transaldolase [Deltaproteobacteria bacterium]MCL5880450.1 transaldolase [Deltaproteobacteria bacterium]
METDFLISKKEQFKKLISYGQSPWLDNISRCLIDSGELERLVENGVITGITSNPSIFEKSINSGKCGYPELIKKLSSEKLDSFAIYDTITREDIKKAAEILLPVFEKTGGNDGFVSIEVPPNIATNIETSINEAQRIFALINKKNVLIKIPATKEGIEIIPILLSKGINVNVTLMFSVNHYIQVANAYIKGLKKALENGIDLKNIHSVASIFISRIDTMVDKQLDELIKNTADPSKKEKITNLLGKAGVANSKIIFKKYSDIFAHSNEIENQRSSFAPLKTKGANIQRLLWASTSTKNPSYYDLKYVEPLIGKNTINTLPDETILHIAEHGNLLPETASKDLDYSMKVNEELLGIGIDLNKVGEKLQLDGVKSFEDSYEKLLKSIENI